MLLRAELDRVQFHPAGFLGIVRDLQLDDRTAGVLHVPGRSAGTGPDVAILVELDLARVTDAEWQRKLHEVFGRRVEAVEGVVVGAADPDHAVRSDVESVGNLVEVIGQRVSRPLLGLGIKLAEHPRSKSGNPDIPVGSDMESARTSEGRVPLGDRASRHFRINPPDAVAVQFRIPDRPVNRRVVEAVGSDAARLALATAPDLSGVEELVLLAVEGPGMKSEDRVATGIGVPDVALGVLRIDPQGVRPRATLRRGFSAGEDGVLLGLEIELRHFTRDTEGEPHVAFVVGFDGVGTMRTAWQTIVDPLPGLRVEGGRILLANVDHVGEAVIPHFEIVK